MPAKISVPLGSRPVLNRQGIAITLTMLLSFTLSTAFMVWQRKVREADLRLEPRAAPSVPERPAPRVALSGVAPGGPVAPVAAANAAPSAAATSAAAPVSVNVWNRRRLGIIEGRVINTSDKPLTVVLEGKDRAGAVSASVFFELNPGEQKSFGTDTGMQLDGGGRVVARVAGYADQEVGIPP